MLANLPLRFLVITASLAGLSFASSCAEETPPTGPEVFSVEFAKGGNGKGGGGSDGDPLVQDTDPPGTEQGTVDLQVRILGSGFEHPAHVRFLMDGDPTGIATSDTADFVSSSELVTTITVAADAPLGLWDVEVELLSNRRKGIGIELFEVVADFFVGWTGALASSEEAVTTNQDNRVTLGVSAASYTVAANFTNTASQSLMFHPWGTDLPSNEPNDNCWLRYPVELDADPTGFDPSVSKEGIAAVLMNTLTFVPIDPDGGSRPRSLGLGIDKRNLGGQHHNHAVGILVGDDYGPLLDAEGTLVELSTNPAHWFRWGQNDPPSGDYLRVDLVSGDANDASSTRVFDLSEGMVRVIGRLGPNPGPTATLICDVHPNDTARVTVRPNPLSTPGKKR